MNRVFKDEDPTFTVRWKEWHMLKMTSGKALSREKLPTVGEEGAQALAPYSKSCLCLGVLRLGKLLPTIPKHLILK